MRNKLISLLLIICCLGINGYAYSAGLQIFEVSINDGQFTPKSIDVESHKRFKIKIKNIGKGPTEFENLSLIVEKTLSAGVESSVVVPPLRPGNYQFIDEFHPQSPPFIITAK